MSTNEIVSSLQTVNHARVSVQTVSGQNPLYLPPSTSDDIVPMHGMKIELNLDREVVFLAFFSANIGFTDAQEHAQVNTEIRTDYDVNDDYINGMRGWIHRIMGRAANVGVETSKSWAGSLGPGNHIIEVYWQTLNGTARAVQRHLTVLTF